MWGTRGGNQRAFVCLLSAAVLLTAACGGSNGEQPAAVTTVTVTTTVPAPATETTSVTPDAPITDDSTQPTEPTDSATPTALAADVAGRPLTLSNIFNHPEEWKDGRFDIADRKQSTGIGGVLNDCGELSASTLELRLANNFSRLKLEFGQSNASESSDKLLMVRVDANGAYQDQKSTKLNQIAAFDLGVQKVNALKIIVYLKRTPECFQGGTVEAVLMNMVLS